MDDENDPQLDLSNKEDLTGLSSYRVLQHSNSWVLLALCCADFPTSISVEEGVVDCDPGAVQVQCSRRGLFRHSTSLSWDVLGACGKPHKLITKHKGPPWLDVACCLRPSPQQSSCKSDRQSNCAQHFPGSKSIPEEG